MKGASHPIVCDEGWVDEFEDDRSVIYLLDNNLRIAYCSKAWDEFAERVRIDRSFLADVERGVQDILHHGQTFPESQSFLKLSSRADLMS